MSQARFRAAASSGRCTAHCLTAPTVHPVSLLIRRSARWLAALGACILLCSCAPEVQSLADVAHLHSEGMQTQLPARYRYLRITANGRALPMVLGFVDPATGNSPLPTYVWYSSAHEVLRLRDGMVAGTAGLPVNWLDVHYAAWPDWGDRPQTIVRTRDVQPGYRFGLRDTLHIVPIEPPRDSRLEGLAPRSLRWFHVTNARNGRSMLYAVRGRRHPQVVYGEQCLAASLCLTWQDWPPNAHRHSRS